jgi:uncharacterized Zn finger protein (UPF0148 family)
MLTINDLHCPICGNHPVATGKGGSMLCAVHGWIKALVAINLRRLGK